MSEGMSFSEALMLLKEGRHVTRTGWNGPGQYLGLERPGPHSQMTVPFIYISTVRDLVPWLASQADLLAEDWQTVEGD